MTLHKYCRLLAACMTFSHSSSAQDFPGDIPIMIEEAELAGVSHRYEGPWEYFVGGGVSTFDCNQDRLPDLYLAGGENSTEARQVVSCTSRNTIMQAYPSNGSSAATRWISTTMALWIWLFCALVKISSSGADRTAASHQPMWPGTSMGATPGQPHSVQASSKGSNSRPSP